MQFRVFLLDFLAILYVDLYS